MLPNSLFPTSNLYPYLCQVVLSWLSWNRIDSKYFKDKCNYCYKQVSNYWGSWRKRFKHKLPKQTAKIIGAPYTVGNSSVALISCLHRCCFPEQLLTHMLILFYIHSYTHLNTDLVCYTTGFRMMLPHSQYGTLMREPCAHPSSTISVFLSSSLWVHLIKDSETHLEFFLWDIQGFVLSFPFPSV
jgi:hypothetical protein